MLKVRRFFIVFLVSIMCLLIAPFHVYADTINSTNVKGVNYSIINVTPTNEQYQQNGNTYVKCAFIHRFEVVLDKEYLGYVTGSLSGNYQAYNSTGTFTSYNAQSGSRSFYVAGNSFEYYMETFAYMMINQIDNYSNTYSATFTYAGSNVIIIDDLVLLNSINDYLSDILNSSEEIYRTVYDSQNGTILEQLVTTNQLLVDAGQMFYNVMLTTDNINNYVIDLYEYLTTYRQYDIPYESYILVYNTFREYERYNITNYNLFNIPFFKPLSSQLVVSKINYVAPGQSVDFVAYFLTDNYFNIGNITQTGAFSKAEYKILNSYATQDDYYYVLVNIRFINNTNNTSNLNIYANANILAFSPIYLGYSDKRYMSDSFAQQFGFIDIEYSQSLDNSNDDMQSQFNDIFDYEDDFNSDMNDALQNINVNFDVGNQLGSKFLASADWVRQQYNTLTSNTPFGTVLSFSLLLGLALLIIGKAVR